MGRVSEAVHRQELSRYCETCEGSRVPRAETGDIDNDRVRLRGRGLGGALVCEFSPRDKGENRDDMLRLRVGDLGDSTHSGPEDHGHVKVRCHPGDGLADSLKGHYRL